VKEQGLVPFAEAFQQAGFHALVFDYRYLGESDGAQRGRIVPVEQQDDLRAALDWLQERPQVDASRIGMWGTSYSGGHTLVLTALDPRVKTAVVQAPALDLPRSLLALAGREGLQGVLALLASDHARRNAGQDGASIPIVAPGGELCLLPTPDSLAWFTQSSKTAPRWLNATPLESVARMVEYVPLALLHLIDPKPVRIIAARQDFLIPIGQVREAADRLGPSASIVEFDCGHFDFYPGRSHHAGAAARALEWFTAHL
jgi:pimeloyl-ACP methyl ester carboxylesterase